ncbi:hypothetical protein [Roseateles sp.]|uniref:hypothetical protein n=1 Tax=Roseateles sp. TaxID=1971397 RepID=UPI0025EA7905|nr:hypothetical protein [Roseateles sp.]MBV8035958.1 hypothetical protein [Roseateles sp.]
MSKIRQALQLLADASLSARQVAAALGISKSTVGDIAMYARDAGVDWALARTLGDDELQARHTRRRVRAAVPGASPTTQRCTRSSSARA